MRIAVDIGFGFVKAMNELGSKIIFPTVIARQSENTLRGIVGGTGDDYSIIYWETSKTGETFNQKKLYVGDAGITNLANRRWEDKTEFNAEDLKVFISTAVGLLNTNNKKIDLVVGLPVSYYLKQKDELISILKDLKAKISYEGITGIREIQFNDIFVFPQGAGAYYSAIFDKNGEIVNYNLANSSVGIIDVGFRTVDYLVMAKGRKSISIVDRLTGSLEEEGINRAFQQIESEISNEIGKSLGVMEIEKAILWFDSKLDYKRNQIDLKVYEERAYKDLAENISSQIKQKWGSDEDTLPIILITGGGGQVLYPILKTKFKQAELQANSSFANCEGYLGAQARKFKMEG